MKKINNQWLIGLLVVLAGVFVVARFFRAPGLESNLRKTLTSIDTAAVTELRIKKQDGEELKIARDGLRWNVTQGSKTAPADGQAVRAALAAMHRLKPLRMVSRKKEKWADYSVNEAGATVLAFEKGRQVADLRIGKTNFVQSPQGGFGGAYTYVRPGDEEVVYAVDGFLESNFNRAFADWRNKAFLRISREIVKKISFIYPADSSFVLEKQDSVWTVNGSPAQTSQVNGYLNHLTFKNLNQFADDFQPVGAAPAIIKIEATGGPMETVEAWPMGDAKWALRSTLQPVIFTNEGTSVVTDLLKGKSYFLAK
jgi:hypothetical protein